MRLSRSLASVTVAVALVISLAYEAMPHARVEVRKPAAPQLFGADCRTAVHGSHVIAYCHNPYPGTDRVSLHIECDRWWDIDIALGIDDDPKPVLADWSDRMYAEHDAVHHLDVLTNNTVYRVFLLADTLQVDIAFCPAAASLS